MMNTLTLLVEVNTNNDQKCKEILIAYETLGTLEKQLPPHLKIWTSVVKKGETIFEYPLKE